MNIKLFNVALGIVLTATTMSVSAQKNYTEGVVTLSTSDMQGNPMDAKNYFTPDSTALAFTAGGGAVNIKVLRDTKGTFFAVLVEVPIQQIKKAAIAKPAEIEQMNNGLPKFTFAPTDETKKISGFNCKKVVATNTDTKKTYDVWVTNDVSIPESALAPYYKGVGGFPVQYTSFSQGQEASVTVTGVSGDKAPAGTFGIAPDFDKITMDDLRAMSGGGN